MSNGADKAAGYSVEGELAATDRNDAAQAIRKLARFGVFVLVVLAGIMFLADFLIQISILPEKTRFLSENLLISMVWGIAAILGAAMAALACVVLWKR
jgi:hypothetical protein